ncbi:MAG: DNA polymerase III subunit beta [Verrucomicrobiota bacterium]
MKFSISKEAFQDGLGQVQNVVSTRTTLLILSNVLLEARDGELQLTTTDLDVGVTGKVAAEVSADGSSTLPARRLSSIIRELPANDIEVEIDKDNIATIVSGPSRFRIFGLSEEEFPPLPTFDEAKEFKIDQSVLKDALKKTAYAISTDESRYVLNGIMWSFKGSNLTLVATDGRRLAMVEIETEFPESHETEVIIPTKAINELQRLLTDEGEVKVLVGESQIGFQINDNTLVSKLIDGNYPNYNQVIPDESKIRITLERETFLRVIQRVSLLASDKSNSVKLSFDDNRIEISANSPDVGEAQETLPVQYEADPITIAFNPEFLMAPLRNLDEDAVYLHLIDEMSPGVLRIEGSFLYVLMPMRVSQ